MRSLLLAFFKTMTRKKLKRFAALKALPNVIEPPTEIGGGWGVSYFKNDHLITLELACGKGEYTLNLARRFPQRNFIGVDIKGERLWKGATTALREGIKNVAFLRIHIEQIAEFFHPGEVDELWIMFPDPYPKNSKTNKRLTSPRFLNLYGRILRKGGLTHFKTDDWKLFQYTLETVRQEQYTIHRVIEDLYSASRVDELLTIRTSYEVGHLRRGRIIKYVCFSF